MFTPVKLNSGEDNPAHYGLGWKINRLETSLVLGEPVLVIRHGGKVAKAATAFLLIFPEHQACIAYATNCRPKAGTQVGNIQSEFFKLLRSYVELGKQAGD